VSHPKADTQPTIATPTAVKYPITKTRLNTVFLLTVELIGINWVRLFMERSSDRITQIGRPGLQIGSTSQ
jgi:hypothetical protein